jgi:Undecaprenyl-phosphate galactose phosphotransferase WbaP
MSSTSRAIDIGQRLRAVDEQRPMLASMDAARPAIASVCDPALPQLALGRACLTQHLRLILPLALADLVVLGLAFLAGCQIVALISGVPFVGESWHLAALIATAIVLYGSLGLFQSSTFQPVDEFRQIVLWSALSVILLAIAHVSFVGRSLYEQWAFGLSILIMVSVGPSARSATRRALSRCSWWARPLLIVGTGESAQRIHATLTQRPSLGFRVVGFVDDRMNGTLQSAGNGKRMPLDRLGNLDDLASIAATHRACWALISTADRDRATLHQTVETCTETIPNVVVVSGVAGIPALWTRVEEYGGVPGMHFEASLLLSTRQAFKRCVDLLIVAIGSPIVVPLMLLTAAAIKLASPKGPIFFGQSRVGKDGAPIMTWKFRTMVQDSPQILEAHLAAHPERRKHYETFRKLSCDPRVIPHVGAFIRKFSLDELPQLWNVIRGEMSLVGPRPMMHEEIGRYAQVFKLYKKMRPGITGLWQVSGRNHTTFQERVDFDAYYVTNWSPWFDLYILVRTIRTVLLGEGAY